MDDRQEFIDRFYWSHGPCCAGCDHWRALNSVAGECTKSAPVAEHERMAMLDLRNCSAPIGAGHPFTKRDHHCGDFKDDFDWSSLPVAYRARVGVPTPPEKG